MPCLNVSGLSFNTGTPGVLDDLRLALVRAIVDSSEKAFKPNQIGVVFIGDLSEQGNGECFSIHFSLNWLSNIPKYFGEMGEKILSALKEYATQKCPSCQYIEGVIQRFAAPAFGGETVEPWYAVTQRRADDGTWHKPVFQTLNGTWLG